jgi:uncharacterized protein (TIGR02147 family)
MLELKSVFDFKDYIEFLNLYLGRLPSNGHGEKSRLAIAMNCHSAYLSKILKKEADLSSEQAHALTRYLRFTPDETDFFLLLVQYARAGTTDLKKHYLQKINATEQKRIQLKNRFAVEQELTPEDKITYFSEWYYPVIHLMLATLPAYQNRKALEAALTIPSAQIENAVLFLERIGAIEKVGLQYKPGKVNIHLGNDSAMISTYHTQWRMQAIRSFEKRDDHDLHYSNTVTIHRQDFEKIRKLLISAIEQVRASVAESKNENSVAVLTMDWFGLW